jgi:lipopolysaccharide/colanic/teichoic acid biosynthesis glycosyltransferase
MMGDRESLFALPSAASGEAEGVGRRAYELVKSILDPVLALLVLILSLPLLLLVAVAIKLDSPGPVLFRQQRAGRGRLPFSMLKFRSMYADQRARLPGPRQGQGPVFKLHQDPRVTRVGRFLRRTSLDELPQFLNVLLGEMSLVGPRPLPLLDVINWADLPPDLSQEQVQHWLSRRHQVRPGLTGLWQISGRSLLSLQHWIRYDLDYLHQRGALLDLKILALTPWAALTGRGAM